MPPRAARAARRSLMMATFIAGWFLSLVARTMPRADPVVKGEAARPHPALRVAASSGLERSGRRDRLRRGALRPAPGNNRRGSALSLRWKHAGAPASAAERADPASAQFGDQLIAVLPRLRRFARGLARAAADADDLVQAACERALARAHQFQEGTRFDSWMFRIVQTIWIDQLRAREVRKEDGDVAEERLGSDAPVRRIEARLALAEVRQGGRASAAGPAERTDARDGGGS